MLCDSMNGLLFLFSIYYHRFYNYCVLCTTLDPSMHVMSVLKVHVVKSRHISLTLHAASRSEQYCIYAFDLCTYILVCVCSGNSLKDHH